MAGRLVTPHELLVVCSCLLLLLLLPHKIFVRQQRIFPSK